MDKIIQKVARDFSVADKHRIIQDMLTTGCTKAEIWEKYTGEFEEHGYIIRWMRALGYNTEIKTRKRSIGAELHAMAKRKNKEENAGRPESDSFENLQLEKRIKELEKQVQEAELKAIAFSTMIDIAEDTFKISIRKKFNTKP